MKLYREEAVSCKLRLHQLFLLWEPGGENHFVLQNLTKSLLQKFNTVKFLQDFSTRTFVRSRRVSIGTSIKLFQSVFLRKPSKTCGEHTFVQFLAFSAFQFSFSENIAESDEKRNVYNQKNVGNLIEG